MTGLLTRYEQTKQTFLDAWGRDVGDLRRWLAEDAEYRQLVAEIDCLQALRQKRYDAIAKRWKYTVNYRGHRDRQVARVQRRTEMLEAAE